MLNLKYSVVARYALRLPTGIDIAGQRAVAAVYVCLKRLLQGPGRLLLRTTYLISCIEPENFAS